MKGITILGATGSIGYSTLDVISRHPDDYRVVALTANGNVQRMLEPCGRFKPRYAVMVDAQAAEQLQRELKSISPETTVLAGQAALEEVAAAAETDYVMAAIVGGAGLAPTLAAARAGKRVLLANKEALVMSGPLFMDEVRHNNAELLPIDSEHNAIFQCMPGRTSDGNDLYQQVKRILLTGSGGPFRTRALDTLHDVSPDEACAHPNWKMGRKISVDSATMMNKGLEIIEACWLFETSDDRIEVVLHPQSIIHSMVEYYDGSVLAQLGQPDMRTPIAHALAWPKRMTSGVESLDFFNLAELTFEQPDMQRYPCLRLAREALQTGGTASTVLNAANEIAVQAFLDRQLPFTGIATVVENVLSRHRVEAVDKLDTVLQVDEQARSDAAAEVQRYKQQSYAMS
jgi:1-deoxy-D-xylulose-5-phosphate reductoisomerase